MKNGSTGAPSRLLRRILAVDAMLSGATGLLLAAGAGMLAPALGLPAPLLRGAGLSLLPFAVFVAHLSRQAAPPRGGVRAVIALNVVWVAASAALLAGGPWEPTRLGVAFVVAQAAAVAVFAEIQYVGLRRFAPSAA